MKYAGIGSRRASPEMLENARELGETLARAGFLLRSGAAAGMDAAFEEGCDRAGGAKEIFLPWAYFNNHQSKFRRPSSKAYEIAQASHPKFIYLKKAAMALHARNAHQVLGPNLDDPVDFVLCYTPDGCEADHQRTEKTGGTGTAITIASKQGIPVINLYHRHAKAVLAELVEDILFKQKYAATAGGMKP
jgi:hypothetical protein